MKRSFFFGCLMCVCALVCAQSVSTDKTNYSFGQTAKVTYSDFPTGGNVYFYHNVSNVPLYFSLENITFDADQFTTDAFEPGLYTIRGEYGGEIYAQTQFRVADIPLESNNLNIFLMSDIHVMARSLVVSEGEAFHNAMDNNRKLLAQSEDVFNQLVDSVIAAKPDLVLLPGDLTKDGEKVSHQVVVEGLQRIEKQGIRCLVIPGNHDYNNPNSVYYASVETHYTPTLTEQEFAQMYADFGYGDSSVLDTASLSYYTDEFPRLRIIGVDATRNRENTLKEWGDSRNATYGDGKLRDNTLQWVLDRADEASKQGRMVILMMHHQMLQHFNYQDKVFSTATISSGDSIAQLFIDHDIRLVLTGHMHINNNTMVYNQARTDSLIEISTGSPIEYPGCWRWLTVNGDRDLVTVNTRFIRSTDEIDDYMLYARDMLNGHADLLWNPLAKMLWNGLRSTRNSAFGSQAPISTFLDDLIKNETEYTEIAYKYMLEPVQLVMLTASEANENTKHSEWLLNLMAERMNAFAGEVINSGNFNFVEKAILNSFVQNTSKDLFSEYMTSLITDCSYCGKASENTTNDLYLTLELPKPIVTALIDQSGENNDAFYYDLLGRRYNSLPTTQGLYLHRGAKIYVK